MAEPLEALPEDWDRALAVVAHPDDMEYGAASAVARWTAQGKDVRYLLVTNGEAGIGSMPPDEVARIRRAEQEASCAEVGVETLEFLGHPDGLVTESVELRRDLALAIRRHRPDVVIGANHHDTWGGPSWNHADHRAVGRALLDAVRDAANPWLFGTEHPAWSGIRFAAMAGSPFSTHAVDVTEYLDAGIASLECHRVYLDNLGGEPLDVEEFLRSAAAASGELFGVPLAVPFELVHL
jgi:LmbE family N-acetylglucosaminyl deacetylase